MIHVCQPGFEPFLAKELDITASAQGPGWIQTAEKTAGDLCFAHYSLEAPEQILAPTARKLAQALSDFYLQSIRGERVDERWPLTVEGCGEPGVVKRANTVEEIFLELAKKRVARVSKLADVGRPPSGARRGLFVYLTGLERLFVSRRCFFGGQKRMADDPQAPSRSYLKVEEAYGVLGAAPSAGQSVVDMGAAPGGWSYSAAKRGAKVIAVDNGPLKGGALGHPLIEHRLEDAFKFESPKVDWLFCDLVEDPDKVIELAGRWVTKDLCRRFVINLKFGRQDPLPLIRRAKTLEIHCRRLLLRHLYHDREELTLVGATKGA